MGRGREWGGEGSEGGGREWEGEGESICALDNWGCASWAPWCGMVELVHLLDFAHCTHSFWELCLLNV